MWKTVQSTEKPLEIDENSSKTVVYVRKDIAESTTVNENGEEITAYYTYQENTIPKEDWDTYKAIMENQKLTTDLELALCDIYETIIGGVS